MRFIHADQQRKIQNSTEEINQTSHGVYSRRTILKRMAALSAAGMLLPGLLSACRDGNETGQSETSGACADRTMPRHVLIRFRRFKWINWLLIGLFPLVIWLKWWLIDEQRSGDKKTADPCES